MQEGINEPLPSVASWLKGFGLLEVTVLMKPDCTMAVAPKQGVA
jgi:hypothetical protein